MWERWVQRVRQVRGATGATVHGATGARCRVRQQAAARSRVRRELDAEIATDGEFLSHGRAIARFGRELDAEIARAGRVSQLRPSRRAYDPAHANRPLGNDRMRRRRRSEERSRVAEGRRARRSSRSCAAIGRRPRTTRAATTCRACMPSADDLIERPRRRRRLHRDAALEPLRARAEGRRRRQAVPGREADGDESRGVPSDGRGVPRARRCPLWVAYYRRALPRFLKVRELLRARRHRQADVDSRQRDRSARDRRGREGLALQYRDRGRGAVSRSRLALLRHHRFSGRDRLRRRPGSRSTPAARMRPKTSRLRRFRSATRSPAPACGTSTRPRPPIRSCSPVHEGEIATAVRADEDVVVDARRPAESLSLPQPSARAPAADSDDRRRAAGAREMRIDRRERRALGVGYGQVSGELLQVESKK